MHAKGIVGVLMFALVGGLMLGCTKKPQPPTPSAHAHKTGTIIPSSSPSMCTVNPDNITSHKGDQVYWLLSPGTKGHFEVNFNKGDSSPCSEQPPWGTTGDNPSKFCTIDANARKGKYRYSIVNKEGSIVCADPTVQVCNGEC